MIRLLLLPVACLLAIAALTLAQPSNICDTNKYSWNENCGWLNFRDAGAVTGAEGARFLGSFASGFVWGENTGWINLGDGAPANAVSYANIDGADFGVNIDTSTGALTGFAWAENAGWINFSGGALASPPHPAVLELTAGRLRGYAWGENIGWINLSGLGVEGFCSTPTGSCCVADGSCSNTVLAECSGAWTYARACSPNPCVQPTGSCCAANGWCTVTIQAACNASWTQGLSCSPNPCTPPCPADINGSGSVSVQDIFDFLAAWFGGSPSADINNSGTVSVQDIFDFLRSWFQGC